MPYISEILNNRVYDSSDASVGRLEDILINPKQESFSPLEFLVIKVPGGGTKFVPYSYVENFNSSKISLKNLFSGAAISQLPQGTFTYLKKDVLDRQIVDIAGTRVVRVNDLRIGNFDNKMSVLGIDSSFRGLLRRLGLENEFFDKLFSVRLIDWRGAQMLEGGPVQVNDMAENLSHLHPADLANIVEELDVKHGSHLLASLDAREAAKVLEELNPRWQSILVKYLGPEKSGEILGEMSSDEIVDLIKSFSRTEAQEFLSEVSGEAAQTVQKLISYPDNTAGGLMTLEYITIRPEWTVAQAIEEVKRKSSIMRSIVYVYITGPDGHFVGVVSLRRLLIASPETIVKKLAKPLEAYSVLKTKDKIEKVIKLMTRYNLYTAAVLDKEKKLVGIVTIDDVMRQLFPSA